jgi:hypothetical protein
LEDELEVNSLLKALAQILRSQALEEEPDARSDSASWSNPKEQVIYSAADRGESSPFQTSEQELA